MQKMTNKKSQQFAFVLVALFVGIFIMTLPPRTSAQCVQWDARSMYGIQQSNNILVKLELNQRGPRLSGNASFPGKTKTEHGTVIGSFRADSFRIEIKWDYGETGVYTGKLVEEWHPKAKLTYLAGDAIIKEQPDNKSRHTTWKSVVSLKCYSGR